MGWDETRQNIARGLGWLRARENSLQAESTTFEQSLLEGIVELDSSQTDAVAALGEGTLVEVRDDGNLRSGELQRLETLKAYFFGDDAGSPGLFDAMRAQDDPNYLADPDDSG